MALSAGTSASAALSRCAASSSFLGHQPLQEVDVALKTPGPLVQPARSRTVLYPRDILRTRGFASKSDQGKAQERHSYHCNSFWFQTGQWPMFDIAISRLTWKATARSRHILATARNWNTVRANALGV